MSGGSVSIIISWEGCGEKWVESKTKTGLLNLDGEKIWLIVLFTFFFFKQSFYLFIIF